MTDIEEKDWFNSLSDEEKYSAYHVIRMVNRNNSDTISEIVDHLLGKDYYTIASDVYGSNAEIIDSIKYHYSDVNYSFSRQMGKIREVISDYIKHFKI